MADEIKRSFETLRDRSEALARRIGTGAAGTEEAEKLVHELQVHQIQLELRVQQGGEIDFRYSDNGKGLPDGFDTQNASTLGLTLIRNIAVRQLQGEIEFGNNNGFFSVLDSTP